MRGLDALACAVALTFAAGPSIGQPSRQDGAAEPGPRQVFSVRTSGAAAVKGRIERSGMAFAITPDILLTAPYAVGRARDFMTAPPFGEGGVPTRTVELRDLGDDAEEASVSPAGVRPPEGPVVLLTQGSGQPPLSPLPLSACALKDGSYQLLAAADSPLAAVRLRPAFVGGTMTHFRVRSSPRDWRKWALGAAVVGDDGKVAAVLTDVDADGLAAAAVPIADVVALLPDGADLACDPRVDAPAFAAMQGDVKGLAARLEEVQADVRGLSVRVEAAEETGNLAMSTLADVGSDLDRIRAALVSGSDISDLLEGMKKRLQGNAPLMPTVSTIDAYLRRPTWTVRAKTEAGVLTLTFVYRTQLPGPPFSPAPRLCMRLIKPFQGDEAAHFDFRSPRFYAAAMREDTGRLVKCETLQLANRSDLMDHGEYRSQTDRRDLESMFAAYREEQDSLPPGYDWGGLAYAVLIRPDTGATAAGQGQPTQDQVILRALILVPEAGTGTAALPVQCVLFDSDQNVIDFLAQKRPPASAAFDDVSGLDLDPQNKSDECVPASAQ